MTVLVENIGDVLQVIYSVIDELNLQLGEDQRIEKRPDTVIFGNDAKLDSLGLVNLIIGVEEMLRSRLDVDVELAGRLLADETRGFPETVSALAAFADGLVGSRTGG